MERWDQTRVIIEEDVRLIDSTTKLAGQTLEYFEQYPATTVLGTIAQGIGVFAIGGLVGGSIALTVNDVRAVVNGDRLRLPFAKPYVLAVFLSGFQSPARPLNRQQTLPRIIKKTRPTVRASRKIVRNKYRVVNRTQPSGVDKILLFSI